MTGLVELVPLVNYSGGKVITTRRYQGQSSAVHDKAQEAANKALETDGNNLGDIVGVSHTAQGTYLAEVCISTVTGIRTSSSSGSGGGDEESKPGSETADMQTIEKPITDAPFWRDSFGGSESAAASAMKYVQLYIDAEDMKKAEAVISEAEKTYPGNIDAIHKMIQYRLAGVESYLCPAPTVSKSTTSKTAPSGVGAGVAKIEDPGLKHLGIAGDFEWLGHGDRVTYDEQSKEFVREQSWLGAEVWDPGLYGEK